MPFEYDVKFKLEVQSDVAELKELLHSRGWKVFWKHALSLLEAYRIQTIAGTKDEFEFNKGLVEGVRRLMSRPQELIDLAEGWNE